MLKKILNFYTKYFALWVLICGLLAYRYPQSLINMEDKIDALVKVSLSLSFLEKPIDLDSLFWFFALTMFGIGVVLQPEDFKRIAKNPTIVLTGSCAQFIIMPFGAFLLAKAFRLPPEIAVGLILTGAAPGAMASNVMSYIAKADTAYSISLTTVSTLLCPLLTPGLTFFLAGTMLPIKFLPMFFTVILTVILPLFAGFLVRYLLKTKIEKIIEIFPAISVTFIIFICSLVIAKNKDNLAAVTGIILAAGLILNIYGMLSGYGIAKLFKMSLPRRRTLAIEIGMQNAGLGSFLALKHFGPKAAMPAAIFVFICIITASIMAELWQRKTPQTNI